MARQVIRPKTLADEAKRLALPNENCGASLEGMAIMTLTGNLLAEWTFAIGALRPGATHRAETMSFQVGGKGINVSRILNRFGESTESVSFAEGPLAGFCTEWLERQRVAHRFFPLETGVRPGLVIREQKGEAEETTFLGSDENVPTPSWKAACQYIRESRPEWFAICGSIPGWRSSWKRAIEQILDMTGPTRICADTYGPPLADLVELPLELVKINRTELNRLLGEDSNLSTAEAIAAIRAQSPVRNWIITDGPQSVTADLASGTVIHVTPARIRQVSPMGSGDTFLAALLHKWRGEEPSEDALSFAAGCATASAASAGVGDFPLPLPERYLPAVNRGN